MGSPPYRQVSPSHPAFSKQCIAVVNDTTRCRNLRICDLNRATEAEKKDAERLTRQLVDQWSDMSEHLREAKAKRLVGLVICGRHHAEKDKTEEVVKNMLASLREEREAEELVRRVDGGRTGRHAVPQASSHAAYGYQEPVETPQQQSVQELQTPSPRSSTTVHAHERYCLHNRSQAQLPHPDNATPYSSTHPPSSTPLQPPPKARDLLAQINQLQHDNSELQDKTDQLERTNSALQNSNQELTITNQKLKTQIASLNNRISTLDSKLATATQDLDLLETTQERLRQANKTLSEAQKRAEEAKILAEEWEEKYHRLRESMENGAEEEEWEEYEGEEESQSESGEEEWESAKDGLH